MNERTSYPSGVPCWIDLEAPDPGAAIDFYAGLFGWAFEDRLPPGAPERYAVATLDGSSVAGVGSARTGTSGAPAWNTYVAVDDATVATADVEAMRGRVLAPPEDVGPAGRMAVIADPAGAELRLWQAGTNAGAQVVNADGSWNWSNLSVPDPASVINFYAAVFGWELAMVDVGGQQARMWRRPGYGDHLAEAEPGLHARQEQSGAPPGFTDAVAWLNEATAGAWARWEVTFAVADTEATAERAAELGGEVRVDPHVTGPVTVAVLADPQGAEFTVNHFDPQRLQEPPT